MVKDPGRETLHLRERVAEIADDTGPGVRGAGIDQGTARAQRIVTWARVSAGVGLLTASYLHLSAGA